MHHEPNVTRTARIPVEIDIQKRLLETKVGLRGSGAARYAAAMYFYQERLIPAALLEIYRRCSKFDAEDPVDLATFEGVQVPPHLFEQDKK